MTKSCSIVTIALKLAFFSYGLGTDRQTDGRMGRIIALYALWVGGIIILIFTQPFIEFTDISHDVAAEAIKSKAI